MDTWCFLVLPPRVAEGCPHRMGAQRTQACCAHHQGLRGNRMMYGCSVLAQVQQLLRRACHEGLTSLLYLNYGKDAHNILRHMAENLT